MVLARHPFDSLIMILPVFRLTSFTDKSLASDERIPQQYKYLKITGITKFRVGAMALYWTLSIALKN